MKPGYRGIPSDVSRQIWPTGGPLLEDAGMLAAFTVGLPAPPLLEDAGALAAAVGAPEVAAAGAAVAAVVGAAVARAASPHARPPRHPQASFLLLVHEETVEELAVVVIGVQRTVGARGVQMAVGAGRHGRAGWS